MPASVSSAGASVLPWGLQGRRLPKVHGPCPGQPLDLRLGVEAGRVPLRVPTFRVGPQRLWVQGRSSAFVGSSCCPLPRDCALSGRGLKPRGRCCHLALAFSHLLEEFQL